MSADTAVGRENLTLLAVEQWLRKCGHNGDALASCSDEDACVMMAW